MHEVVRFILGLITICLVAAPSAVFFWEGGWMRSYPGQYINTGRRGATIDEQHMPPPPPPPSPAPSPISHDHDHDYNHNHHEHYHDNDHHHHYHQDAVVDVATTTQQHQPPPDPSAANPTTVPEHEQQRHHQDDLPTHLDETNFGNGDDSHRNDITPRDPQGEPRVHAAEPTESDGVDQPGEPDTHDLVDHPSGIHMVHHEEHIHETEGNQHGGHAYDANGEPVHEHSSTPSTHAHDDHEYHGGGYGMEGGVGQAQPHDTPSQEEQRELPITPGADGGPVEEGVIHDSSTSSSPTEAATLDVVEDLPHAAPAEATEHLDDVSHADSAIAGHESVDSHDVSQQTSVEGEVQKPSVMIPDMAAPREDFYYDSVLPPSPVVADIAAESSSTDATAAASGSSGGDESSAPNDDVSGVYHDRSEQDQASPLDVEADEVAVHEQNATPLSIESTDVPHENAEVIQESSIEPPHQGASTINQQASEPSEDVSVEVLPTSEETKDPAVELDIGEAHVPSNEAAASPVDQLNDDGHQQADSMVSPATQADGDAAVPQHAPEEAAPPQPPLEPHSDAPETPIEQPVPQPSETHHHQENTDNAPTEEPTAEGQPPVSPDTPSSDTTPSSVEPRIPVDDAAGNSQVESQEQHAVSDSHEAQAEPQVTFERSVELRPLPTQVQLSIGIETTEGLMQVLLPRGTTKYTATARLWTSKKGQDSVVVRLYEGERPIANLNHKLCEDAIFAIDPSSKPAPLSLTVTVTVDSVELTLTQQLSGKQDTQVIRVDPFRLSDAVVERAIQESAEFAEADDIALEDYIVRRAQYGGQATLPPATNFPPTPKQVEEQQQQQQGESSVPIPTTTATLNRGGDNWIGIDFGMTRTYLCGVRNGNPEFINEPSTGLQHIPSFVWYALESTEFGLVARNHSVVDAANTVTQMSRFVGRRFSTDSSVNVEALVVGYDLRNINDRPYALLPARGEVDMVDVAAEYLKYLRQITSANAAVISLSFPYDHNRMNDFQAAARSAGFEKVDIVKDTQLIVSSYLDSSLTTPEQTILVINIGGRTTHASAVRVSGGNVQQEIASRYDADFGFEDFERRLTEYVLKTFVETYGMDASESLESYQRLQMFFETNFMEIFTRGWLDVSLPEFYDFKGVEQKIFLEELELLNQDYMNKILQMSVDAATESANAGFEVNRVIVAGAAAKVPGLRTLLLERFPGKYLDDAIQQDVPPEKRIAHGACKIIVQTKLHE